MSSTVPSMCLRAKDHLEGTKVAVSPRHCAAQKVQTGSAAAGGHRRVATRETTGDMTTRRGAGDPKRRAEWTTVSRYGHLRSAPVVVDVGVRTEREPPTLRAALWLSTRPSGAPPRWLPASPTTRERVCRVVALQDIAMRSLLLQALWPDPEVRERCRVQTIAVSPLAFGLCRSVRSLFHSFCDRSTDSWFFHALAGCGRRCATLFCRVARCIADLYTTGHIATIMSCLDFPHKVLIPDRAWTFLLVKFLGKVGVHSSLLFSTQRTVLGISDCVR